MDLGSAVVALVVGAFAVLPRVPALTAAGRAQAGIQRDVELWAAMPEGKARDLLGEEIEERTDALLQERQRDKTVENGWMMGTAWAGAAWVLLVASTAVPSTQAWAGHLRTALQLFALISGALGVFILTVTCALVLWKGALRVIAGMRARRRPPADTFEI